jgi:hypothetical protein
MKKILPLAIAFSMLATGCIRDHAPSRSELDRTTSTLTASFDIPDARQSRASLIEAGISSLWVMVFNESGNYIDRYEGVPRQGAASNYDFPGVPISDVARTLHFVANYDWSGFSDVERVGQSEITVLHSMTVTAQDPGDPLPVAYWQRKVLESGISPDVDDPERRQSLGHMRLLRNVARVTVRNATAGGTHYLTQASFAVGNRYNSGTVAPFDTRTFTFGNGNDPLDGTANDDTFVTEAPEATVIPILEGRDMVPAGESAALDDSGSVLLYERRNSGARDNSFIILRARFDSNQDKWSYYKVVVADSEISEQPLDMVRNWRYNVTINSVTTPGYSSIEEAIEGPANNIDASVVASEYTDISNGTSVLHVDKTNLTLVATNREFKIGCFFRMGDSDLDNSNMVIGVTQDEARPAVIRQTVRWNVDPTTGEGYISGVSATRLPVDDIHRATITISKGGLSRSIALELRPPMRFTVDTDPADGLVDNLSGSAATLWFSFPDDISPSLFPITVRIYTHKFTPVLGQEGLTVGGPDNEGDFYYNLSVPAFEPGRRHPVRLLSLSRDTGGERVCVEADLFEPNDDALFGNRPNWEFVTGRTGFTDAGGMSPVAPRDVDTDTDVRVSFELPAESVTPFDPLRVTLHAPWLDYVPDGDQSPGLKIEVVEGDIDSREIIISGVDSPGPFHFTVRNSEASTPEDRATPKFFKATWFNPSADLNQ